MKRDLRLRGLSSEHHHTLVFVRRIRKALQIGAADARFLETVRAIFEGELEPHFEIEEELLLPALAKAGHGVLVSRTLSEHERLRNLLSTAGTGRLDALEHFASLLEEHVRFEERELYPACEERLDTAVLDELAERAPKRGTT